MKQGKVPNLNLPSEEKQTPKEQLRPKEQFSKTTGGRVAIISKTV